MLLEPIYEHDFYDCSFGFRPRRSAHQALEDVWKTTMDVYGGWVLEVDIRKFFDSLDHKHLQEFVSRRVRDGVLGRLIGKWLNAGVMEEGELSFSESGSPQNGSITNMIEQVLRTFSCLLIRLVVGVEFLYEKRRRRSIGHGRLEFYWKKITPMWRR